MKQEAKNRIYVLDIRVHCLVCPKTKECAPIGSTMAAVHRDHLVLALALGGQRCSPECLKVNRFC